MIIRHLRSRGTVNGPIAIIPTRVVLIPAMLILAMLILGTLTTPASSRSIHDQAGTSGFSFLKVPVGARAAAMGGASVSLAEDATVLYWNPAGLTQADGQQMTLGYVNYLLDIHSGFFGYVLPRKSGPWLGAALNYFSYGQFQETTVSDPTGSGLGTFGAMDIALSFSAAYPLQSGISIGGTAKVIYSRIEEYSSDAYAVDLGGFYPLPGGRTKVAASIQNLGFQRSGYASDHTDGLAPMVRLGASHRLQGLPLLLSVDLFKPTDHHANISLGGELIPVESVFFRLGWSSLGEDQKVGADKDDVAGFSAGVGVRWQQYGLDYALSSRAQLGEVHRVTMNVDL
jgi:hypothetical protein